MPTWLAPTLRPMKASSLKIRAPEPNSSRRSGSLVTASSQNLAASAPERLRMATSEAGRPSTELRPA